MVEQQFCVCSVATHDCTVQCVFLCSVVVSQRECVSVVRDMTFYPHTHTHTHILILTQFVADDILS